MGGLVSVVLALLNMQDWGPSAAVTITPCCPQARFCWLPSWLSSGPSARPLSRCDLLRIPAVTGSLFALFAIQFAILGLTVYMTLYLQLVLGYSAAVAGALTLPTVASPHSGD